jgi:hypothetical protein
VIARGAPRWPAAGGLGLALALAVAAACAGARPQPVGAARDPATLPEQDVRAALRAELEDAILTGYGRVEPPDVATVAIDARVGAARIGVGPGDVLIGPALAAAPSRWPLDLPPGSRAVARSKRLEVHLSQDATAAWASDEISWRLPMCGRVAAIPLRMTALYAREGDRWLQVFEHLSFGRVPAPARDGKLRGTEVPSAVISPDLVDELSGVLAQGLFRSPGASRALSTGPEALVLGPGLEDEWHSAAVRTTTLPDLALRAEDRRVGLVGIAGGAPTVAYWVGNLVATLPARPGIAAGKARVRGTFVFERRRLVAVNVDARGPARTFAEAEGQPCPLAEPQLPRALGARPAVAKADECRWVLVQSHVSQPIDDGPDPSRDRVDIVDLATSVFGTALVSAKPLEVTCDDGSPPLKAPAAAPRRRPPAGGTR